MVQFSPRSTPTPTPPGLEPERFTTWLARAAPALSAPARIEMLTGGRSNLTLRVHAVDGSSYIVRRPPLGLVLRSANDMAREVRVQRALRGTLVPVPEILVDHLDVDPATGVDSPFYVMSTVPGYALQDTTSNHVADAEALRTAMHDLARVLAVLHDVDVASHGLSDFGRPTGYAARQLNRWSAQLAGVSDRALPYVRSLAERLDPALESRHPALCHGDPKPQNALFSFKNGTGRVTGLLDWEMSTVGDAAADIAQFGLYWTMPMLDPVIGENFETPVDLSAGYPRFRDLLRTYAEVRPVPDLTWHTAFACFKTAVISELIHQRYLAGMTVGPGHDSLGVQVEVLGRIGHEVLDGRQILDEG